MLSPLEAEMKIHAARQYRSYGYGDRLRLLKGKALAFKETGPMDRASLEIQLRRGEFNLGFRLWDRLLVKDEDGPRQGPFAGLRSPMASLTSRGRHDFFQLPEGVEFPNRIKIGGLDVDILTHGVVTVSPSRHPATDWLYRWENGITRQEELPIFPVELLKEFEKPKLAPIRPTFPLTDEIEKVRRYIGRILSVQGEGGDRACFRAACRVAEATGGDFEKTLALMREWNASGNAQPEWSEAELIHKCRSAIKSVFGR